MLHFLKARNVKNENETDAESTACFQNIKNQLECNVLVYIDSIGDS